MTARRPEGVEVDCIDEVLADGDLWVEALGFAQGHLTHLIDEVLIGDDVTRTPNLEVTLLLDVDDDVKGIVRAKHLRQDISEGILHDRDQRIAVDTLELLILKERSIKLVVSFFFAMGLLYRFILLLR